MLLAAAGVSVRDISAWCGLSGGGGLRGGDIALDVDAGGCWSWSKLRGEAIGATQLKAPVPGMVSGAG
jgi:hypothetical protein